VDNIAGPAEVHNYGHGAARQSFEYNARTVVAQGRKYEHISGSHAVKNFCMAEPAAKRNIFRYSEGSCELLEIVPFRAVTDDGETRQSVPQDRSSGPQSDITRLPRNQTANENQLEFGPRLGLSRILGTEPLTDARFRYKK
jgi:hypothetical protein